MNASAEMSPWFTGPLLAPAGRTIPKGHLNFEPYYFYTDSFGVYGSNWKVTKLPDTITNSLVPVISYGLSDRFDLQGSMPFAKNSRLGQSNYGVGDANLILGFQVHKQSETGWFPDLRASFSQTLPFGKYRNLNPRKRGVDSQGAGSYQMALGLNFQQLSKPFEEHYLRTRLSLSYAVSPRTKITGFNSYGGGIGTNGHINPGNQFQADLAFEYQLTQRVVPVFEVVYMHRDSSSFSGRRGRTLAGLPATSGHGEVEQISLAPAIEYQFNGNCGIIGGAWFSVAGKESNDFFSAVVAFNYYM